MYGSHTARFALYTSLTLSERIYKYLKYKNLKRMRQKLKKIKDIPDVISVLKELNENNSSLTTDNLLNKIYVLYLLEPPSDIVLQIITILFETYMNTYNIEEFAITTLWTIIFYYADNLPKIKKQKTWP